VTVEISGDIRGNVRYKRTWMKMVCYRDGTKVIVNSKQKKVWGQGKAATLRG